jgi:ribosome-associated protein
MDIRKTSTFTDYFVICDGTSDRQVKAIADGIRERLDESGIRVGHIEGYKECLWILLDYVDVVVHVFYTQMRRFYDLERLWGDAERLKVNGILPVSDCRL